MIAIVLSIGDELVTGQTVNTNSAWLSQQLAMVGVRTVTQITVDDKLTAITREIEEAASGGGAAGGEGGIDFLLISGGLGPTLDDLTRDALAAALEDQLVEDAGARAVLEAFFSARHRPMTPSNLVQAYRPKKAVCLPNSCGTAPGLAATLNQTRIFAMPGVPREMKEMFTRSVLPEIRAIQEIRGEGVTQITMATKLNTFGIGESALGERIADLMRRDAKPTVGTTASDGVVAVRIYATGTPTEAAAQTQQVRQQVYDRLGPLVYGENSTTLEAVNIQLLTEQKLTLATAESCTGGLLAQLLTSVPGASACFQRGWITYADAAKREELGVPSELITREGAVSEAVVKAMAAGARERSGSELALAITGIAGPDGGTPEKPVGTVWIALASPAGIQTLRPIFPGTRDQVRLRAAQMALALLRWHLLGVPLAEITSMPGSFISRSE